MELDKTEKRSLPVSSDRQIRIHLKRPVFAFLGEFVLADELEGGAGHHRKAGGHNLHPDYALQLTTSALKGTIFSGL